MMFKIIILFLVLIVAVATLGSTVVKFLRGSGLTGPAARPAVPLSKCAHCGRTVKGTAPCVCGQG